MLRVARRVKPPSLLCSRTMADCFNEPVPTPPKLCPASANSELAAENVTVRNVPLHALPRVCANLGKLRLTYMVAFTTAGGYLLSPAAFEPLSFVASVTGVIACSIAANSFNQFLEYPFDSQMARTRVRVLPSQMIKPHTAVWIGVLFAVVGTATLYVFTTPAAALLGFLNILLYSAAYTPLKRCSPLNTHVGSLVGSVPPLIGWTASSTDVDASLLLMCAILYSWQFVHFNALSWNLRSDYCKAGYQMMAVVSPKALGRSTFLHSLVVLVCTAVLPFFGLTTSYFTVSTLPLNLLASYYSWRFLRSNVASTSRRLFHISLFQVATIVTFMIIFHQNSCFSVDNLVRLKNHAHKVFENYFEQGAR